MGNKGQHEWGTDNWLESGWDEGEEVDKNQAVEDFLGFSCNILMLLLKDYESEMFMCDMIRFVF